MKILICDDQAIVRDGLAMMLKLETDMEVVSTAEDGAMALDMVTRYKPDLVLMDLKMPVMNGVEATRQIKKHFPEVKVLVLTTYSDDEWVFDAIRAGASGYLLKDTAREELIKAIRGTINGKTYVDPSIAGKVLEKVTSTQTQTATHITGKLTDRELEVLKLIASGLSNADIAKRLSVPYWPNWRLVTVLRPP